MTDFTIPETLHDFIRNATKDFDASHDYDHAIRVTMNTIVIAKWYVKDVGPLDHDIVYFDWSKLSEFY